MAAAIISIDRYNQFPEYLEWKKISDTLNELLSRERIYKALNNLPAGDIKKMQGKIIHFILD